MHSLWFLEISTKSLSQLHVQSFNSLATAPPEKTKVLDLVCANVKYAYSSSTVWLCSAPTIHLLLSSNLLLCKLWKKCFQEVEDELQGCFESTDWSVCCESHDTNAKTECVTDHNFCVESILLTRTVRCFISNKFGITSDLRKLLNIKKETRSYWGLLKKTVEKEDRVKGGVQKNTRKKAPAKQCESQGWKRSQADASLHRANELNVYFSRFSSDQHSACSSPASSNTDLAPCMYPHLPCHTSIMSPSTSVMAANTASPTSPPTSGHTETSSASPFSLYVSSSQGKKQLERLNQNKAAGPNGVSPLVPRACAE